MIPRIDNGRAYARNSGAVSIVNRLRAFTFGAQGSGNGNGHANGNGHGVPAHSPAQALEERLVTGRDPRNPVAEAYRSLRTNITFARLDDPAKTLVFTSPMPGDGKTTSAANLAITLVQQGIRTLLVDADMRRGLLHTVLGAPRDPGLSNVLFGKTPLEQAIRTIDLGESGSLDFLPTGVLPPNPAELLGSARMRGLLEKLEERYEMIILDAPPLNVVTDAALLGTNADGVVLIARAASTDIAGLAYAMELLRNVRAPALGVVLNDVDFKRDIRHQGSYGYYQYYYTANEPKAEPSVN
jgi:capsular exopolysaccharide synthesis family protein